MEDVSDDEVVEGIRLLARTEGIFAETAGGVDRRDAAQAARRTATLDPDAETVVFNTGDGLKTLDAVCRARRAHRDHPSSTMRSYREAGF